MAPQWHITMLKADSARYWRSDSSMHHQPGLKSWPPVQRSAASAKDVQNTPCLVLICAHERQYIPTKDDERSMVFKIGNNLSVHKPDLFVFYHSDWGKNQHSNATQVLFMSFWWGLKWFLYLFDTNPMRKSQKKQHVNKLAVTLGQMWAHKEILQTIPKGL